MSTRSSIVYTGDSHIYSEGSEPKSIFGKWIGDNVYITIAAEQIKSFRIQDDFFYLSLKKSELSEIIGNEMRFWGGNVESVTYDFEGMEIVLTGGSYSAKKMESKEFTHFQVAK